jgi:hypothetical protein
MPSSTSLPKRDTTNKKNTQQNKLPATVKELLQLQKAVAESLMQMGEEKNCEQSDSTDGDSEPCDSTDDSEPSDTEENFEQSDAECRNKQQAPYQNMQEDWSGHNADRIDSDVEAKQSEKNESEEEEDLKDTSDEELEDTDSHKEQQGGEQKARWTDDSEDSEPHGNAVTQHKQKGHSSVEESEESSAEEQTIDGKITPAWYGDANKGLLRRRMGIKADLPLQQQNAIVRTLRKLVRTKCGSDLDKPWSTYGRTVQNRMINSMYNTSSML